MPYNFPAATCKPDFEVQAVALLRVSVDLPRECGACAVCHLLTHRDNSQNVTVVHRGWPTL